MNETTNQQSEPSRDIAGPWLPAYWARWTGVKLGSDEGDRMVLRIASEQEPFLLTDQVLTVVVAQVLNKELFDPRANSLEDRATSVAVFLKLLGPLDAPADLEHTSYSVVRTEGSPPETWRGIPVVPKVVDIEDEFHRLKLLRLALLVSEALRTGKTERLQVLMDEVSQETNNRDSPSRLTDVDPVLLQAIAAFNPQELPSSVGWALEWLARRATERPMLLHWMPHSGRHGARQLLPAPECPWQIIMLSLATSVGAVTLPGLSGSARGFRYCSQCGLPIWSSRQRKSGNRWFCDPPEGEDRSRCRNRFFTSRSKSKKRARALVDEGLSAADVAKRLTSVRKVVTEADVLEWTSAGKEVSSDGK